MEHKVSIIVPIYNVEQYIRKCVDSILNQTYDNLEIILIDDGSPDKCGKICDEYAEIDSRIKVIHKKNGGLSDARNAGLKICTGKYLTFIGADDYLLPNYVADLISNIKNADICIGGYCTLYDGTVKKPKYKFERKVYSTDKKISLLEHLLLGKDNNQEFPFHLMSVWKNLYKSDFIKENNLTFVSERKIYAEDFIFNLYAYYFSKSIVLIDNANIVHLINKESLSQSYRKNYFELQKCLTKTTEEFISTYLSSDLLDEYNKRLPNMLAYSLFKENRTNKNTAVENTKKILLDPYAIDILLQFKKCESGLKESIIYYFAKHHRVKCIYYFVKMLTLGEPLYRIMRLRK